MNDAQSTIEACINEVDRLRTILKKVKAVQVKSADEKAIIKATSLSWFNNHRMPLVNIIGEESLSVIDNIYRKILALSDKSGSRKKFDTNLKDLKTYLSSVRSETITKLADTKNASNDKAPDFMALVRDSDMVTILERRWSECIICVNSKAPLSATVMMGGLLESLLLTRFLQFSDKRQVFTASSCPKDKTGTALQFKEWVLRNYIDVAHELGWISQTEKDIGEVLRDYRNYIHPFKEKSHGIIMQPKDAVILWEVTKSISRQIINFTP
ncbi:hypothetical protein FAM09_11525 [Niastella caeni]|uniref:Uncharacterized protein n=1 Tax=Niastella caeni TaxID=2569763 RepID=A0A4S8HXM4_9BACT|nr:hypothetical protein [Niastella caeni]THU40483.1 hypothetical protein FAM09_11525 [Niastella caeni]